MSSGTGPHVLLQGLLFGLVHYAAIVGLGALSYAVGRRLTARCQFHSLWERAAVCTSLGLGAISYGIFVLCAAHWLYPSIVLGVLGIAAVVCAPELGSVVKGVIDALRTHRTAGQLLGVAIAALVLLLPYVLLGLYPPTDERSYDALAYHLVVAKLYVQHHGFVFAPYVHFSLFPQLTEMLFTLMLMFLDDVAARLVSLLPLAVLITAVFAWGEQLFSRTVGYWASAILLGIPIVIWLGSTAYVDLTLTLFVTMAVYSCWNWLQGREPQWLILAAIFAGFATATKLTGIFFVGVIALIVLFYGVRKRSYSTALVFVAIAAAIAAPWYARSVYYTGNPIFPFLSSVLGHGYWSAEDAAASVNDIRDAGNGRSLRAFVSLPWQLAFHPAAFHSFRGIDGPRWFFLAMPVLIPFAFTDRRIAFLGGIAFSQIVFWFALSQWLRYLVPVFPLISLAMAAALSSIILARQPLRRWAQNGVIVAIIGATLVYPGWRAALNYVREYGALPVTPAQRDTFLTRFSPAYPVVKFLNSRKGQDYTVFPIGNETMGYFATGTFLGEHFGAAGVAERLAEHGDNQGFYRELRALGVTYLLVDREHHRLREDEFFRTHFRLVYARPPVELYEVVGMSESQ